MMDTVRQDVRYAIRTLTKNAGFTAAAVLILALGIGANTTIFSVVDAVLFRPLPFPDQQRMVVVQEIRNRNEEWQRHPRLTTALDVRAHMRSFENVELAVGYEEPGKLRIGDRMEAVRVQFVSPNLLPFLGIKPVLGRNFLPEDVKFSDGDAIILSHAVWEQRLASDASVIGKSTSCGEHSCTVIGVLPPNAWVFPWAQRAEVWKALNLTNNLLTPDTRWFTVIGRLKNGTTLEQARAELAAFGRAIAQDHAEIDSEWNLSATRLHEYYFGGLRKELYLLLGAVGFVLLIGCANVANLMLVRGAAREKEIAIRASLGASRMRLVRQLLTECILIGLMGGVGGLAVSGLGVRVFSALAPEWVTGSLEIRLAASVLVFTFVISVATGMLFGLAPSVQISRAHLAETLKSAGSRSGSTLRHIGRSALVIGEIALTLILLVGAGLMVNSVLRLVRIDAGFNTNSMLTADIQLIDPKYRQLLDQDVKRVTPEVERFYDAVSTGLAAVPGIRAVAMQGMPRSCEFHILGQSDLGSGEMRTAVFAEVSPDFTRTLEVPQLAGRVIVRADDERAPWVAVVNQAFVKRYFAGRSPLGTQITVSFSGDAAKGRFAEDRPREIVGVIGDIRSFGLNANPPPSIYVSDRQHVRDYSGGLAGTHLARTLFLRTASNPLLFSETLRKVVADADRDQSVVDISSMEQALSRTGAPWRFFMYLFGVFSVLATCLASVGIYGVISYSVTRRTHEIGLRLALGATNRGVLAVVLRQGLRLTLTGIAVGVAAASALTRLMSNLLYEVKPTDPVTFAAVSVVLTAVAMAACYVPARHAAKVDPATALRHE